MPRGPANGACAVLVMTALAAKMRHVGRGGPSNSGLDVLFRPRRGLPEDLIEHLLEDLHKEKTCVPSPASPPRMRKK
jgi:hypothetical protein